MRDIAGDDGFEVVVIDRAVLVDAGTESVGTDSNDSLDGLDDAGGEGNMHGNFLEGGVL